MSTIRIKTWRKQNNLLYYIRIQFLKQVNKNMCLDIHTIDIL